MKKIITLFGICAAIMLLSNISVAEETSSTSSIPHEFQVSKIPDELNNQVFHWRYTIGWGFRVLMTQDALHWEGIGEGMFNGLTDTVTPLYREISDGIYLVTWKYPVPDTVPQMEGFDSLVLNLNDRVLYGHTGAPGHFASLTGEIYCVGYEEVCEAPHIKK